MVAVVDVEVVAAVGAVVDMAAEEDAEAKVMEVVVVMVVVEETTTETSGVTGKGVADTEVEMTVMGGVTGMMVEVEGQEEVTKRVAADVIIVTAQKGMAHRGTAAMSGKMSARLGE
mmetsp:Transcript_23794/g.40678  ORF Transcript_23794/g.40678 Transcript_23794/m.40678 type:complete len:116 (+) Transcript_23794:1280-1627(+)